MNYFDSTIYGIIQGLSEFLPISSSGHLALLPELLNIDSPGLLYDFAMHIGTFVAIILYFRKTITSEVSSCFKQKKLTSLTKSIILTTTVSVIFILLLKSSAEVYRTSGLIAFNLIFFGIIMGAADLLPQDNKSCEKKLSPLRSALIGLAQAIAIFPGVSRSGATITMARLFKINRSEAASYSFLISIPMMVAGIAYKLPAFIKGDFTNFSYSTMYWGAFVSFVVGLLTIHFFLKFVTKFPLYFYSIYRIIIGVLVWWVL